MNLARRFLKHSEKWGDKVALDFQDKRISYKSLKNKILHCAKTLDSAGVKEGDRVILMFNNSPEFIISYYAITTLGAIVVPVNVMLKRMEIMHILSDSQANFAVFDFKLKGEFLGAYKSNGKPMKLFSTQAIENFEEVKVLPNLTEEEVDFEVSQGRLGPNETSVIIYTSGTTGKSKGVELTNQNLASNAIACVELMHLTSDVVISGDLPLYHTFGQTTVMNASLLIGAEIVLHEEYNTPEVLADIEKYKVNIFVGVPAMFYLMVSYKGINEIDFSSLKYVLTGGDSIAVPLAKMVENTFNVKVLEGYGLTETSPVVTFNQSFEERKLGSIGFPIHGVQVKLVDSEGNEVHEGEIGEIIVRGENVMKGYWRNPEATAEVLKNNWLYTRDMAWVDEEGYYYIAGRKDNMIIKSGFNIYPSEVEEVILKNPKVKEVAVIGVSDRIRGEEPKAYIVLKENENAFAKEMIEFCRKNLANYKCPKYIEFCDSLPKNELGKVLKKLLKSEKRTHELESRS
ncbi:MAG: long-chain fatty acid--CoA ligase [Calditrichaeota bacterium]|nr:MAG: long-chain fatty acid--CoA ligase [Calditrichota bacterium]